MFEERDREIGVRIPTCSSELYAAEAQAPGAEHHARMVVLRKFAEKIWNISYKKGQDEIIQRVCNELDLPWPK